MDPVNNHNITNEISLSSLATQYGITEEYSTRLPEDSARALLLAERLTIAFRTMDRLEQAQKEVSCDLTGLEEDFKALRTEQSELLQLEKKNTQALQNLVNSSSELKEMTSNIANFAKRFFKPVQNGFYLLTGRREPAAVLPRENQLAIEYNPENTISITATTNQPPVDEKKLRKFLQVLCSCWRIMSFACGRAKNLVMFLYSSSIKLISKINLWFRPK